MKKLILIMLILFFGSELMAQTSTFNRKYTTTSGAKLTGRTVALCPTSSSFPADTIQAVETPALSGNYVFYGVADGDYNVYINGSLEETLYIPASRLSDAADKIDSLDSAENINTKLDFIDAIKVSGENKVDGAEIDTASINGGSIAPNAIDSSHIKNNSLVNSDYKNKSISINKIDFIETGKNKFDKNAATLGYYMNSSGVTSANATYLYSGYIEVNPGVTYVSSAGMRHTCYFDSDTNVVAGGTTTTITSFTVPAGVSYVVVTTAQANIETFQLEIGSTASAYESFRYEIDTTGNGRQIFVKNYDIPADDTTMEYSGGVLRVKDSGISNEQMNEDAIHNDNILDFEIKPQKTAFLEVGKNKFNKHTVTSGYRINNTGVLSVDATYGVSDYIAVEAGKTYYGAGSKGMRHTCYFDSNYAVVAGGSSATVTSVTIPSGVSYIRFSFFLSDLDEFQFEAGSAKTNYTNYSHTFKREGESRISIDEENYVDIQNSSAIIINGCSYTAQIYAIKNKSWVNKLAQNTDYVLYNYGVSGTRLSDQIQTLLFGYCPYGSITASRLNPRYIVLANLGNEELDNYGNNLDAYRTELVQGIEAVKSFGASPILGTDHFSHPSVDFLINNLSYEKNILGWSIGEVGDNVLSSDYAGFWFGSHPGTRTNAHTWIEWNYLFSKLPEVDKSINVYRVRTEYEGGTPTVEQLAYDSPEQRVRYYQEINAGEIALNESSGWEYYDRLDEGGSIISVSSEYASLINKSDVAFSNYMLAEIIIDRLQPSKAIIEVAVDVEPTGIYLANNRSDTTKYTSDKNGAAFKVTKTVYDAFSETDSTQFTSDATGADTLYYRGKVKGYGIDGYYLMFDKQSTASADAGTGDLTKLSDASTTTYTAHVNELALHKYAFLSKIEQPWSRFEDVSNYATYSSGVLTITLNDYNGLHEYLRKDKFKLLLNYSGTMNISDIKCFYYNGRKKADDKVIDFKPKASYTELADTTYFDSTWTNRWTNDGATLGQMPSAVRDYPPKHSANYHIVLDYDTTDNFPNTIKQTFTVTSSNGWRKVIVRAIARLFPKIYDTTETPSDYYTSTRQITADSYDYGRLVCAIGSNAPYAVQKQTVDIGWSEITFESFIPPYLTSFDVMLYRDEFDLIDTTNYRNHTYPLQLYDVSVQVEE